MEEKLDEIIKLLKGIDEKLEVLVNQKVPKSNNSNKAILLKQYEIIINNLNDNDWYHRISIYIKCYIF